MFLQNSDDLLFREAATFHVLVLSMGQNELETGLIRGARSHFIADGMIVESGPPDGLFEHRESKRLSGFI